MTTVYLHGGGDDPAARAAAFGPMVAAFLTAGRGPLLIVATGETEADAAGEASYYVELFGALGLPAERLMPLFVSQERPLTGTQVAAFQPSGLFVCGGPTPLYHRALCADLTWVDYLREANIPYGGTSAGAAIAAERAILGGWRAADGRPLLFQGAGEGLDTLTVRPGAGLVPFAVDVHAGQMGTLTRLIQAVARGQVAEGWGIDEDTLLVVESQRIRIEGRGYTYHVVKSDAGRVAVNVLVAPMEMRR